jgi:GTP cyclohydrolase II
MSSLISIVLPTRFGNLKLGVSEEGHPTPKWVLIYNKSWEEVPFLRIHSSCLFSESFFSKDCDCAMQLEDSLKTISSIGGAIVYLYQEGRGHGLFSKVKAIAAQQEHGIETAEAYHRLGYELDPRQYAAVGEALATIDFPSRIRLATNNPRKIKAVEELGYEVVDRAKIKLTLTEDVANYVKSKVIGLGHYESD